jgi:hypothetical protein
MAKKKQEAEIVEPQAPKYDIHKVKYTDSKGVVIEYSIINEHGGIVKHTMECGEDPRPEFKEAFRLLNDDVAEICEFPDDYRFNIETKGVTFTPSGIKISAMKDLEVGKLQFNTPLRTEDEEAEHPLTPMCRKHLRMLKEEASLYIEDVRAQGHLFKTN